MEWALVQRLVALTRTQGFALYEAAGVIIYSWFTEGFDTVVLRQARMLLEALGGANVSTGALYQHPNRSIRQEGA